MAAKPNSSFTGLLKLEEQLTCPVCLDLYTNPKTLPCLHSFCQECLEGLPLDKEGETYYLSCPTCRKHTELPEGGAGTFPVAFTLNNLKETHSLLKAIPVSDPQQETCNDHGKPLELFCETCETVICHYCAVRTHKDHKYELVTDCYPKHYQKLEESLKPIKEKMDALDLVLSTITEGEAEIREEEEKVLQEIQSKMEEMINALHQSEKKLTEQVKRVSNARLQGLAEQKQSVENNLKVLKDIEDYVEQNLKTGTHQQVLSSKKRMMERINEVAPQNKVEESHPIEEEDGLRLIKDDNIVKTLHNIGDVVTVLQQCKVKIGQVETLPVEKKVSFSLSMKTPDSFLISVPVSSLKCNLVPVGKGDEPIHTTVTTTSTHPGVYRIHCNPRTSGTHTVKVEVYSVQLGDTSLAIPINPYLHSITPVRTIPSLTGPWGVAISNQGYIIIAEHYNNCVTLLNHEEEKVKSFSATETTCAEFYYPRGTAITPDNYIIVSDDHSIRKIPLFMHSGYIPSVGTKGSGPCHFNKPDGIAVSPITEQFYVADRNNHRIHVLNPKLNLCYSFGSKGSGEGEFRSPSDVAIDSEGLVYVTDRDNHRIQKFTSAGKFVKSFGSHGSGPGQLNKPVGIAIDTAGTGLVYVSEDGNHRVSVFTSDDIFFRNFGSYGSKIDQFRYPRMLAFDKNGFLYVCDLENDRMVIY